MPNKKKLTLVRPGSEEARAVLLKYERHETRGGMHLLLMYLTMGLGWSMLAQGTVRQMALVFVAGISLLMLFSGVRSISASRAYRRHLEAGDFVTVDHHLVTVWDELRGEEDVPLTEAERDERVRDLFYAAQDLQGDLARRKEIRKEPELAEELLLVEARIRARLLREVTSLKQEQETRRQLAALAPDAIDSWATPDEVEQQRRILRERRDRQALSSEDAPAEDATGTVKKKKKKG